MPFVPSKVESERLRAAIDRARFSEGERIGWIVAFIASIGVELVLLTGGATWVGVFGALGGLAVLYWRLRGGHLLLAGETDRELHGVGLRTREQRAFTALMLRHAFTGANPMRIRRDHDPLAAWGERMDRAQAPSE